MSKNQSLLFAFVLLLLVTGCSITKEFTPVMNITITSIVDNSDIIYECQKKESTGNEENNGFENILPGITTQDEAIEILGNPLSISNIPNNETLLEYNGFSIIAVNNIIYEIMDNRFTVNPNDLLSQYGCPDIIIIIPAEYDLEDAFFIYPKLGLYFNTFDLPLSSESLLYITYIATMNSVEEFLASDYMKYFGDYRIVSWNDVVKNS